VKTTAPGSVVEEVVQPLERCPEPSGRGPSARGLVEGLAVEVAELWPPRGQWTEADYFALPDTNRFIELSEGELIVPPHPTHTHQLIVGKLYRAMYDFVVKHNLGIIQIGPLPVRLWPGKIREPDILFVAREHSDRIGEQAYGPPDLVVEVLSPATRRTDRLGWSTRGPECKSTGLWIRMGKRWKFSSFERGLMNCWGSGIEVKRLVRRCWPALR